MSRGLTVEGPWRRLGLRPGTGYVLPSSLYAKRRRLECGTLLLQMSVLTVIDWLPHLVEDAGRRTSRVTAGVFIRSRRREAEEEQMTEIDVVAFVDCEPDRIREILLDRGFLEAFVQLQHPAGTPEITIDHEGRSSHARWTLSLRDVEDLHPLVRQLVGNSLEIDLRINVAPGAIDIDAAGRRTATLRSSLGLAPREGGGTDLTVQGDVTVNVPFSSRAERMARDQVLKPILENDLFPLIRKWKDRPAATT